MKHRTLLFILLTILLAACWPQSAQPQGQLAPITAKNSRLYAGRSQFEVRGINYIRHSSADPHCTDLYFGADANCPWDLEPIRQDFAQLQALNINTIRVFVNYYAFGGARVVDPNYDVNPPLQHLSDLIAEANKHNLYVIPVLMAKYPQDQFGPDNYKQTYQLHIKPVVEHLANTPGILAWDMFNEIDLGGPVHPDCWDWDNGDNPICLPLANQRLAFMAQMSADIKQLDPDRLITVSLGFGKNYFRPQASPIKLADSVDLLTYHYYDNDPYDSGRYEQHWYYGKGFPEDLRTSIRELQAFKKPIVVTELGFPTGTDALRNDNQLKTDLRESLKIIRKEKISGMVLWPFQEDLQILVGDLYK